MIGEFWIKLPIFNPPIIMYMCIMFYCISSKSPIAINFAKVFVYVFHQIAMYFIK